MITTTIEQVVQLTTYRKNLSGGNKKINMVALNMKIWLGISYISSEPATESTFII